MRRTGSASDLLDIVFKLVILLFCLLLMVFLVYAVFISDVNELRDQIFKFVFGTGLISGLLYAYMRWRTIEIVYRQWQSDPDSVSPELLKETQKLIRRPKKGNGGNG